MALMGSLEDAAHFVEVVAGVQQHHDPQPVAAPLFDFVEVAAVSIVRVIGFCASWSNANARSARWSTRWD
jgi:hypothetical protein